ncbi:putative ABC transport system permease protein [Tumebacillus sp. BK434]|uniref:FtsX-like permease family protein n=1 Tax=Tumebacillus sp. BK434 TaxID=2512169 RepID=UPI0010476F41|nr:ABC transporter permease [Tumebacillus sp. BK434]TCP57959.1 putative ABC transport system permease protein [Tumebacillus sp. BK434]
MNFLQFASNNVRRNLRAYSAYLLSSAFAVMIFFMYAMFYFHPGLEASNIGGSAKLGMKAGEYVIFAVSFLFVLYSISSFLKVRQKEFGVLTILGASGRQINTLLLLENLIIGAASIVIGIAAGLVLSKLFLLLGAYALEMNELPFYLSWEAVLLTAGAFFALFLSISLLAVALVRKSKVLDLLQGSHKPKPEPKASWFWSLLCVLALGTALYLLTTDLTGITLLPILVLGMWGTYLFFSQLSVFFMRLLKQNLRFVWGGAHLLWVSEMAYKIKDNARMFFLVTIVMTMACSSFGIVLALKQQNEEVYRKNPVELTYLANSPDAWEQEVQQLKAKLEQAGLEYQAIPVNSFHARVVEVDNLYPEFLSVSEFNKLAAALDYPPLAPLRHGEAALVQGASDNAIEPPDRVTTSPGDLQLQITERSAAKIEQYGLYLILSDADFAKLRDAALESESRDSLTIYFNIPAWSTGKLPASDAQEVVLGKRWVQENRDLLDQDGAHGLLFSRAETYMGVKELASLLMFIGSFIAGIFSLSTASFLHFRLYTDLQQDQISYRALSKIGVSVREMQRAATIQMAALFFIPVLISALQTLICLNLLKSEFSLTSIIGSALIGICFFAAAQLLYFFLIRGRYLSQLKKVML